MGGRGGSSGISVNVNSVTAINDKIKDIDKKMQIIGKKMETQAKYAMPGRDYDSKKSDGYYRLKSQYENLRSMKRQFQDKLTASKIKNNNSEKSQKIFVNGFGEATKREITSQTYERAQKRLQNNIESWFGRGMNKKK